MTFSLDQFNPHSECEHLKMVEIFPFIPISQNSMEVKDHLAQDLNGELAEASHTLLKSHPTMTDYRATK